MSLEDKDIELIERYLLGEATSEEKNAVEQRLKRDQEFAEEVDFVRRVILATREKGEEIFRDKLNELEGSLADKLEKQADTEMGKGVETRKTVPFFRRKWFYYAATIAAVVAIGTFFMLQQGRQGPRLFGKYFTAYPNEIITYARGDQVPEGYDQFTQQEYNLIVRAMKYYERKNFEKARELFEANIRKIPENAGLMVYLSICQMQTDKHQAAIQNLEYVLGLSNPPLEKQAQWYLALAHLKNNQTAKAVELLQAIAQQPQHPFRDQAQKIVQKIK